MFDFPPGDTEDELYMIEFHEGFSVFSMDDNGDIITNDSEQAVRVEWIWASNTKDIETYIKSELEDYEGESPTYAYRKANRYELSAYVEGEIDGRMIGSVKEAREHFNGILYRMERTEDGGFVTSKGFNCGRCQRFYDFEENAVRLGDMYLAIVKDDVNHVLWHVCKECT
jgi:hypothetical protein